MDVMRSHYWWAGVCFYPESSLSAHSAEVEIRYGGVKGRGSNVGVCRKASNALSG